MARSKEARPSQRGDCDKSPPGHADKTLKNRSVKSGQGRHKDVADRYDGGCAALFMANLDLRDWLHGLDSYTNAEFGHARTIAVVHDVCVACGGPAMAPDAGGLCPVCAAKRRPDHTEIVLFRALRRPHPAKE